MAGLALTSCSTEQAQTSTTASGNDGATVTVAPTPTPTSTPPAELPNGGREIFPKNRLVGFSGVQGDPQFALGRLTGNLNSKCAEIRAIGTRYARGREVLPIFEMITVVVHGSPGADGKYRSRQPKSVVREYLRATRRCKGLLLLNIQPGRSEFMPELKYYENFLKEPDVGVALDPEWAMDPGKVPNRDLGRTDGAELNESAIFLSNIVKEYDLPEKVMVFHQFNHAAVENVRQLKPQEGVAIVRSVDGLGGPESKTETYNAFKKSRPKYIHPGFKLFYTEDVQPPWGSRLMTPREVMNLKPQPEYILYE